MSASLIVNYRRYGVSVNLKKIITAFAVLIAALLLLSPVSADDEETGALIEAVALSDNCDSVSVSVSISDSFASGNDRLYLFRLPPGNTGKLDGFIPAAGSSSSTILGLVARARTISRRRCAP